MMALDPWYKVAHPREEVREGRSFNPDEFALAPEQLVVGTAPADYRDPITDDVQAEIDATRTGSGSPSRSRRASSRLAPSNTFTSPWSITVAGGLVDLSALSTVGSLFLAAAPSGTNTRALFNALLAWGLSMPVVGATLCCFLVRVGDRRPR